MYMTLRFCDIIAWLLPNFPTNGASNQLKNFIIHWYILEGRQKYSFFMYHFFFSFFLSSPLFDLLPPHPECRQSQPSCKRSSCGPVSSGGLGLCHAPSHSDNLLKLDLGQSNWKTAKCNLLCGMETGIAPIPYRVWNDQSLAWNAYFNRFVYFISLALSHKRKKETFLTLPHPIFPLGLSY